MRKRLINKKISNTKLNQQMSRRRFLSGSMSAAAGLGLRTLATGLPVGFLMTGAMPAYGNDSENKKLILAMSDDGESINSYSPGTYASDTNDVRSQFHRPNSSQLGLNSFGEVNGNNVFADDFANSAEFMMGDTKVEAAKFLSYLPQDLLDRSQFFHLNTAANGHAEGINVHGVNSGLTGINGRGKEEIQSALMQEMLLKNSGLTSILTTPMVLNGGGGQLGTLYNEGVAITRYSPLDVKNLFLGEDTESDIDKINRVYEHTIDSIYNEVKQNGTPAQLRYLDAHASSRSQAVALGDELGELLTNVTSDSRSDQIDAAVAMLKANLATVVVIRYSYSSDNHSDPSLRGEVDLTIEHLNTLTNLWNLLKDQELENQINYANYDIFGRTFLRNSQGGRDHHRSSCVNMMIGSNIKPGVIGGLEALTNDNLIASATGINSNTGLSENPDITNNETLLAYARTLMSSVGISEERLDVRLPAGKTVFGAMT